MGRLVAALFVLASVVFAAMAGCSGNRNDTAVRGFEERGRVESALGSGGLVVSQVYGGGGSGGATYPADYVELFNRGTSPVSLNGLSIQYASEGGTFVNGGFHVLSSTVTVQPGRYYLVKMMTAATTFTADETHATNITMSATSGKVALVSSTTALPCGSTASPCTGSNLTAIIDLVGYDTNTTMTEPLTATATASTTAPAPSITTAVLRKGNGCTDTDSNVSDFVAGTPNPRNSTYTSTDCTATADAGADADAAATSTVTSTPPTSSTTSAYLFNEIKIGPTGASGYQFFELVGPPSTTAPANVYIFALRGDSATAGDIAYLGRLNGTSFGTNGLLYVGPSPSPYAIDPATSAYASNTLTNNDAFPHTAVSFVLVQSTQDVWAQIASYSNFAQVVALTTTQLTYLDAVGFKVASADSVYGGVDLGTITSSPYGLTRFLGNTTSFSTTAWYYGRNGSASAIDYTTALSANFPAGGRLTPTAPNTLSTTTTTDAGTDASADASDGAVVVDATPDAVADATPDAVADATPDVTSDASVPVNALINEVKIGPIGGSAAGLQYIELTGSGTIPANVYFVAVDGTTAGVINYARSLSGLVFGSNGLIYIAATASAYTTDPATTVLTDSALASDAFSHNTASFLIVRTTGTAPAANGNYTALTNPTVVDAVGYATGTTAANVFGGANLGTYSGPNLPHGVTRFLGNTTALSAAAWYWGRTASAASNSYATSLSANFPAGGRLTPGAPNSLGAVSDAGTDAGTDAATDAGRDAATDSGKPTDSGSDATTPPDDSGPATDGSPPPPPDDGSVGPGPGPTGTGPTTPPGKSDASTPKDSGAGAAPVDDFGSSNSGCSCRTASSTSNTPAGAFALGLIGLAVLRLRRRR